MKTKEIKKRTTFAQAPLPFQGQKRRFLKEFKEVLKEFPCDTVFVDLFGGSGLLSHTIKTEKPNARVIWNDYDNFQRRLELIPITNEILGNIRPILQNRTRKSNIDDLKPQIISVLKEYSVYDLDYITLSANLVFSGKHACSLEELMEKGCNFYNVLTKTEYNAIGYLQGVERVSKCYKELIVEFKDIDNVVFVLDPPYLFTDVKSYNGVGNWKIGDYLAIVKELTIKDKYIYFGSNKGQLLDLFDALANDFGIKNPFDGASKLSVYVGINKGAIYEDLMIYKY